MSLRQQAGGRIDRLLHVLRRGIDISVEVELHRDRRIADPARRTHLGEAGNRGEFLFERGGDRRGHRRRAGAGIAGADHDCREIDARQRRDRQQIISGDPEYQDAEHQQRCRDRPMNERCGKAHRPGPMQEGWSLVRADGSGIIRSRPALGAAASRTRDPFVSRYCPSTTIFSPGCQTLADDRYAVLYRGDLDGAPLDGVVVLDHVGIGAVRPVLHGLRRNGRDAAARIDDQPHIDEQTRPQPLVLVGEARLQLQRAGRLVDLVVDQRQLAGREQRLAVLADRLHDERLLRVLFADFVLIFLRHRKDDVDRPDLRDRDECGALAGAHHIAGIDEAGAEPAVDRRLYRRIGQVQFRCRDLRLITLDRSLQLPDLRLRLLIGLLRLVAM